jgi:hypothetical protein
MVAPARPQFVLFGSSIVQLSYSHTGWGSFLSDIYSRKVIHIHSFFFSSLILHFLNTSFIISRFYLQCHNNYIFLITFFNLFFLVCFGNNSSHCTILNYAIYQYFGDIFEKMGKKKGFFLCELM